MSASGASFFSMFRPSSANPGIRFAVVLLTCVLGTHAADFYVSSQGSDSQDGQTPRTAWKTVARVNRHIAEHGLGPGDGLLFKGGSMFEGELRLSHAGGGRERAPVRITSYGRGRAVLKPGTENGILLRETPWVSVSNLNLVAAPGNLGDGIRCDRDRESSERISGITIRDCSITGFGWHGIMVDASQRSMGFSQVVIERCETSGNRYAGIMVYGGNPSGRNWRPHTQVSISDCLAFGNPGDPAELKHHSGSGIFVDGVDTATIRGCVAAENGAECRNDRGGPVGIWAHASRRVVIERCESYGNSSLLRDGGGFDLDGGCEESVMRWNFSHHNHGPGFLVYTYSGAAYADRDCQVLENISWNDGARSSGYAGIQVGAEEGCRVFGLKVERNTVISAPGSVASLRIMGHSVEGTVRSNLVVAPEHGILVSVSGFRHRLQFEGNHYWRSDGKPVFLVDSQWAVPSLASWRNATGPDFRFVSVGEVFQDPGLRTPRTPNPQTVRRQPSWPRLSHKASDLVGAPASP